VEARPGGAEGGSLRVGHRRFRFPPRSDVNPDLQFTRRSSKGCRKTMPREKGPAKSEVQRF
jgi:hypothetical protein